MQLMPFGTGSWVELQNVFSLVSQFMYLRASLESKRREKGRACSMRQQFLPKMILGGRNRLAFWAMFSMSAVELRPPSSKVKRHSPRVCSVLAGCIVKSNILKFKHKLSYWHRWIYWRTLDSLDIFGFMDKEAIRITTEPTQPIAGQKPGTSGLRKKVTVFQQHHYTHNFIQSYFNALRRDSLSPKNTLLVGGDGRFFSKEAANIILQIACANGVDEVFVAKDTLMSTPACSAYIRHLNKSYGNCLGGILLTASHNPGGPTEDFGIKFNSRNGGPAQEEFTNLVFEESKRIQEFKLAAFDFSVIDFSKVASHTFRVEREVKPEFKVTVVENVENYISLMKEEFDFTAIQKLLAREDFSLVFDGMHGAAGPYAKALFQGELKGHRVVLKNCVSKEDFNKCHPDPNLEWAKQLVEDMGIFSKQSSSFEFGAACDGDADRNMILGRNFFVTPSDSLAILVAHSNLFLKRRLAGVARSMPTSGAVDNVAKKLGLELYETPTGWKFFGNLMEEGLIALCGEESFGTGSSHIREKDGLWTILAWLQVIAKINENTKVGQLKGVKQINEEFWATYGRNYYCRYDFENCETDKADQVWQNLSQEIARYGEESKQGGITGVNFKYHDCVDKSVSDNQGFIFKYADGSRVIFRKSGTGSVGTTLRVYFEKYNSTDFSLSTDEALKEQIEFGLAISGIEKFTGKSKPDVKT